MYVHACSNASSAFLWDAYPSVSSGVHQRLIIPIPAPLHFFVVCFDFSLHLSKTVSVYDSLKNETTVPSRNSTVTLLLVHNVNEFFNTFVLHDDKHISLHENLDDLLERRRVKYKNCPCQQNGHDCGNFAVSCVLHLSERHSLDVQSFMQHDITKTRSVSASTFSSNSSIATTEASWCLFRKMLPYAFSCIPL